MKLDIIGLMCIPPFNQIPTPFFQELNKLNKNLNLKELSMGMSSDYTEAVENSFNLFKNLAQQFLVKELNRF